MEKIESEPISDPDLFPLIRITGRTFHLPKQAVAVAGDQAIDKVGERTEQREAKQSCKETAASESRQ